MAESSFIYSALYHKRALKGAMTRGTIYVYLAPFGNNYVGMGSVFAEH